MYIQYIHVYILQLNVCYMCIYQHTHVCMHTHHMCHVQKRTVHVYVNTRPHEDPILNGQTLYCVSILQWWILLNTPFSTLLSSWVMSCPILSHPRITWQSLALLFWAAASLPRCEFPQSYLLSSLCFSSSMQTWTLSNVNFVAAACAFLLKKSHS